MGRSVGYSEVSIFCTVYVCVHPARVCVRECLRVCEWIAFIFVDDVYIVFSF